MHNKLITFPNLNVLTLKNARLRQDILKSQLNQLHLNVNWFNGYHAVDDAVFLEDNVTGNFVNELTKMEIAIGIGHLSMIQSWYENCDEPIGLFCEDDISLDCVEYWNFNWQEFMNSLPTDWNVIQLVLVKELPISNFRLQKRTKHNWSAAAYLITRSYAKILIDSYIKDSTCFELTIPCNPELTPTAENLIYQMGKPNDYTFPILTENVAVESNFYRYQDHNEQVKVPNQFSEFQTKNWWKSIGCNLKITDLTSPAIPVIGTAVVNSAHWVARLLMSIDYPVDNFFIINNNGRGELDDQLESLKKIKHKWVKKVTVTNLPGNIGCSGAWNLIIKSFIIQPYWIIVNDDVAFSPGLLREMVSTYNKDTNVDLIHPNSGDFSLGSWDLFLITENAVRSFGLFDENLYPAYCEDADYIMRTVGRPCKKVLGLSGSYYHGYGTKNQYEEHGSQTKKNEPVLTSKIIHSNLKNWEYMQQKWGDNWRVCSPYAHPFNKSEIPITYCSYDIDYVRKKHLGF